MCTYYALRSNSETPGPGRFYPGERQASPVDASHERMRSWDRVQVRVRVRMWVWVRHGDEDVSVLGPGEVGPDVGVGHPGRGPRTVCGKKQLRTATRVAEFGIVC